VKRMMILAVSAALCAAALALGCSAKAGKGGPAAGPTGEEFKGKLTGGAAGQKGVGTGGMAPFAKKSGGGAETAPAGKTG